MWKPGQLITIERKVYRVHNVKSQWFDVRGDHPCRKCDLHNTPQCLLHRSIEQTCLVKLGLKGYLKCIKTTKKD